MSRSTGRTTIPISRSLRTPAILGLLLVSCDDATPPPGTSLTQQTDIACQDVEGLSFADPEAWTTVSEDYLAYAEWLTDAVYRFDAGGTVRQDVAALTVFDGVLYAGFGDWHFNAGSRFCPEQGGACAYEDAPGHGIPLVRFSSRSSQPVFDHILPEEQIGRFRRTGDALLVPGIDPSDGDGAPACCLEDSSSDNYCADEAARTHEHFQRGTLYVQSHDGWFETDTLDEGIHVFDVGVLDGVMYAAGASKPADGPSSATVWRSDDGGRSWSILIRPDDAPHSRFVSLAPLGAEMLVFGYDQAGNALSFRIDRRGDASSADLVPELRGIVATEPFTRDAVLAWSTSGRSELVEVLTTTDEDIAVRALEGIEGSLVATYLLCAGDVLLLTSSGKDYAVDRTRDLAHLERLLAFESDAQITSFAFWDDGLVFGADGGQLLLAARR